MSREPSPNGNTRKQNQEDGSPFGFYDFFAGGGMAGLGLGLRWKCLMANDFSEKKARAYRANFPPASEPCYRYI